MTKNKTIGSIFFVLINLVLGFFIADFFTKKSPISLDDAYARPVLEVGDGTALYVEIENKGVRNITLDNVTINEAERTEIHTIKEMEEGYLAMRKVDFLTIPFIRGLELKPGGHHIMAFKMSEAYPEGSQIIATLSFSNGQKITQAFDVINASTSDDDRDDDNHDHHDDHHHGHDDDDHGDMGHEGYNTSKE